MTQTEWRMFQKSFSAPRTDRYWRAAGNNPSRAIQLYSANLKLSSAFHPLLGIFEVVLRNKIHATLTEHFGDEDWMIHQKNGFMSHPSLSYTDRRSGQTRIQDFLKKEIIKSEESIRKTAKPLSGNKVISELTFGFWTELFEKPYYRILKGLPIQIFEGLPSGWGRKEVSHRLNQIRRLRNRINHNEPICFKGDLLDFTMVLENHDSLYRLLELMNPQLVLWVKSLDPVPKSVEEARSI